MLHLGRTFLSTTYEVLQDIVLITAPLSPRSGLDMFEDCSETNVAGRTVGSLTLPSLGRPTLEVKR